MVALHFPNSINSLKRPRFTMDCTDSQKKGTKNERKYYLLVTISETEFDLCGVASEV